MYILGSRRKRLSIILLSGLLPLSAFAGGGKKIAITVDDLPVASATPIDLAEKRRVTSRLLQAMTEHGASAVGFVNEDKLLEKDGIDGNVALLQAWLEQGMELGNHTFGHLGMHQNDVAAMKAAVIKGEPISRWLSDSAARPYRYFRHPFTQTGDTVEEKQAFESFLASRGYTVVPFTIENTDYLYSCIYDGLAAGKDPGMSPDMLVQAYLEHLEESVKAFESMSEEIFGRQVPQIWLVHANRLNAETFDASLQLLRERGYDFIALEEALQDPVYEIDTAPSGRFGPSWLSRWARSLDKKISVYGQPEPPEQVMAAYRAVCE